MDGRPSPWPFWLQASMPRPTKRDAGQSLPPQFGGQRPLTMYFVPGGAASSAGGFPGQGMMVPMAMPQQEPPSWGRKRSTARLDDVEDESPERGRTRRRILSKRHASRSDDEEVPQSAKKSSRGRSGPDSDSDADEALANNYRYLGGRAIYGDKAVLPKTQKIKALQQCDEMEYNPLRLSALEDSQIDELVFFATGCSPAVRLSDLKIKKKGQMRQLLVREHLRLKRTSPSRFTLLAADYGNLAAVVKSLGYPEKFLALPEETMGPRSMLGAELPSVKVQQLPPKRGNEAACVEPSSQRIQEEPQLQSGEDRGLGSAKKAKTEDMSLFGQAVKEEPEQELSEEEMRALIDARARKRLEIQLQEEVHAQLALEKAARKQANIAERKRR